MGKLCVSLFGKFSVKYGGVELPGFETMKVQELFCYLLLYRARPHPRENIADLLWGDNSTSQAKRYLSKALWQLQAALAQATQDNPFLVVEPDWIQLNTQADLWLDVADFEQTYHLVKEVPGDALDARRIQDLNRAVQWYGGDLLEGWYQDWCLCERERLQFIYMSMLDKLIRFCEAHGEYETGRIYGYKILRYDRAREQTHRQLMRLYCLAGDRTGALRQFQQCRKILKEELDVGPSRRTQELYEKIRADTPIQQLTPSSRSFPQLGPISSDARLLRLVNQMKQLRTEMESVELDLQSYIKSAEVTPTQKG